MKKILNFKLKLFKRLLEFLGLSLIILIISSSVFNLLFSDKIYPGVKIASTDVSGKTKTEALEILQKKDFSNKILLRHESKNFTVNLDNIEVKYDPDKTVQQAYLFARSDPFIPSLFLKIQTIFSGANEPIFFTFDSNALDRQISLISKEIDIEEIEPSVELSNKKVVVNVGKIGIEVKKEELRMSILKNISQNSGEEIIIPVVTINNELTESEAKILKERAEKLVDKILTIVFEKEIFTYLDKELITILGASETFLKKERAQTLIFDLAKGINREPQNAKFEFREGKVQEFIPSQNGIMVNEEQAFQDLTEAINKLLNTEEKTMQVQLAIYTTKPEIVNEDVNNLGIREIIGTGESIYKGSISSRVHNLLLAASRLNGVLIKPGAEFSFNKTLGDISLSTGFQKAFVIKEGKTILDDGGGVCQTSTTFFRAVLSSGLPILERHQHSYRVSYYELGSKPGFDAAIYLPNIDLRIKNDTSSHILIQTKNDPKNSKLVIEFYGTKDGRSAQILNYRQFDPRPAPPDLYQEDPTLPSSQLKQVEKSIPGLKTSFEYKVTKQNEVIFSKTFYSNFSPWQAVYLQGTGPQ